MHAVVTLTLTCVLCFGDLPVALVGPFSVCGLELDGIVEDGHVGALHRRFPGDQEAAVRLCDVHIHRRTGHRTCGRYRTPSDAQDDVRRTGRRQTHRMPSDVRRTGYRQTSDGTGRRQTSNGTGRRQTHRMPSDVRRYRAPSDAAEMCHRLTCSGGTGGASLQTSTRRLVQVDNRIKHIWFYTIFYASGNKFVWICFFHMT